MGSTFYLFYMVLFTGGVLWCLFLWLVRDDEEDRAGSGDGGEPASPEVPSPAASAFAAKASADESPRPLPPEEAK